MSSFTLFLAVLLLTAVGLFSWASGQMAYDNPLAMDICSNARSLCRHPNSLAIVALGVLVAHFLVRGVRH